MELTVPLSLTGVHVPACVDVDAHIDAAVREAAASNETLEQFVERVRADWGEEQQIADSGDAAVIAYWSAVEADFLLTFAMGRW